MIVSNRERDTTLGEAIEVAQTATQKVKGLLGRECLEDGQGLLFKGAGSLHTLFMRFPIDIVYADSHGKVVKLVRAAPPFRVIAAPLRGHYALELPVGAIDASKTRNGDHLVFQEEARDREGAA